MLRGRGRGFLFTAVPNWTGRMPKRGIPLVFLLVLWTLGRGSPWRRWRSAAAGGHGDRLRFPCAGRNWRNLKVVVPVLLYLSANVVFHAEVMRTGTSDVGRRLGFAVVIFLIMLIGGRIIPSFTRNWLSARGDSHLPRAFGRFDAVCLLTGGAAMVLWTVLPFAAISGLALVAGRRCICCACRGGRA